MHALEVGHYGIGKVNSNGLKLLEICSELNFAICNAVFNQKHKHKATWTYLKSKHGHIIDFIITHKCDLSDVCNVRVL